MNTEYFIGKKFLLGYSLSAGFINRSHKLQFTREVLNPPPIKVKKSPVPSTNNFKASSGKLKQKFSAAELLFSTVLDPTLEVKNNKPIRGRLPNNICDFLLPLMKQNIIRICGNISYDIGPVTTFQDIPIILYISVDASILALVKHHKLDWNNETNEYIKCFHDMLIWLSGDVSALNEEKKSRSLFFVEKNPGASAPVETKHNDYMENNEEATMSIDDLLEKKTIDDAVIETMEEFSTSSIVDDIRLKTYQMQAVQWMIHRESEIEKSSEAPIKEVLGLIVNSNGLLVSKNTASDGPKDENATLWTQVD